MTFFKKIKDIYQYREMIRSMVHRNLRGRYKASILGFAWTFINPLLQLLIYTILFSVIMRAGIDKYYLFLFVALIPWIGMSTSISDSCISISQNSNMVTKIYFPRLILPIVSVTTCFVNMLLCMIIVLVVCTIAIGLNFCVILYLIPLILVEYIMALGIAFIISSCNVYVRDLEHLIGTVLMAWQFLTPIMYSEAIIPARFLKIFMLNPMAPIIIGFRNVLYYKVAPQINTLLSSICFSLCFFFIGLLIFSKLEKHFAEEL